MIISIRNQFKQTTFRYVAFLIVVILAISMVSIPALLRNEGSAGASWAFKINGKKISYQEFAREIAEQSEFLTQIRTQYGQYADLLMQAMNMPTDPKALAFDILMKHALMNQFSTSLGIYIDPSYITEKINDKEFVNQYLQRIIPMFVFDANGMLSPEKLKIFLQHRGLSIREFERKVEQSLAQIQAMHFVVSSCYVPSFDIKQTFIAQNLGKQFSYITFSLDSFLAAEKNKTITDDEIKDFYNKENNSRRRYWVPEKRDGKVFEFNAKNYAITISDEQINEYYEDNKVSKYVLEPIKIHVQRITEKQLSPDMTLEMVKEELKNNPESVWATKWQDVTPFARGERKDNLEKEAFLLQNPGDISSVITTKEGKVIIQLIKRIPRTYKSVSTVKNEIKNILIEKQFKKSFAKDLKELIKKEDAQTIESFIEQKGSKRKMAIGVIKDDTPLAQELFRLKKDEYGFFMDNETGIVVLLTNIVQKHLPEADSIKDVIKDDLYHERAINALSTTIEEAKKAAAHSSFAEIAKKYNGSLQRTDMIYPDDTKTIKELDKKGLNAQAMLNLDKEGTILTHNNERTSFLIKVDAIEEYDQNKLSMEQTEIKTTLIPQRVRTHVESFVASLHRNATLETNESIIIEDEKYSE